MNSLVFTYYCTSMMKERNTTIDFLRGLAVLLMILIHATAYFLGDPTVYAVWDYTHFAVPLFVFCSGYIFFAKDSITTLSVSYVVKRLKRLVIPYYLFLIPFFILVFIKNPTSFNIKQMTEKILLSGGRDLSWLVILFIYFLFLIPVIHFMYRQKKWLFYILTGTAFVSTVLLLISIPPVPFRYVMWLPWTFFLIFTLLFANHKENRYFFIGTIILSVMTFFITRDFLQSQGKTLVLTENKYPPNLYYLSYGIFFTTVMYWVHRLVSKNKLYMAYLQKPFDFLSTHSYSLFFIHFLFVKIFVDYGFHKIIGPWWFFVVLLFLSAAVQKGILLIRAGK